MTNIYLLDINSAIYDISKIEESLGTQVLEIVGKYKVESDRKSSILAWALLKKYLLDDYNINLNTCLITFNKYGKPFLDKNIYFNITHSSNYVGVIVSTKECGIDIEVIDENRDYKKLGNKILSNEELNFINSDDDIIRYWTVKETYYKKIGSGIQLSKLKENIDFKDVVSQKIIDSLNNKYYLSFVSDENKFQINRVEAI